MAPPRPPGSAKSARLVRKLLISFVRPVARLVETSLQIIRMEAYNVLKSPIVTIRPVFLRLPPYPPRVRARRDSRRSRNEWEVA